jgi:hypothetical protein
VGAAIVAGAAVIAVGQRNQTTRTGQQHCDHKFITLDTVNFLGADESFNLVSNDENVRDEIAASLYYKDIGSRKGLTVAESDMEYEASSDNIKNVYTNKAIQT